MDTLDDNWQELSEGVRAKQQGVIQADQTPQGSARHNRSHALLQ